MAVLQKSSLRTHLGLLLVAFAIIPTLTVAWLAYDQIARQIADERIKVVGRVADAKREQFVMSLQQATSRAGSALKGITDHCGAAPLAHKCVRQELLAFVRSEGALGAALIARGGTISVGESVAPDRPDALFAPPQLAAFSEPLAGAPRRYYVAAGDPAAGVRLAVTYDSTVIQPIFTAPSDLGASGETFLADGRGFFVTSARYPAAQGHSDPITARPMARCLQRESAETLDLDYRDIPIIHGFRFLPEIGAGCIMAHIDQAEAFAPLLQLEKRVAGALLLFVGLAALAAFYFSRRTFLPLLKLANVAHEVAAGNRDARASAGGASELAELAELASAFNTMTDRLAQANADLERRVAERTLALHESEERWKFALEGAGDGVWDWNLDTGNVTYSPRYFEMLGYPPDTVWDGIEDWKDHVDSGDMESVMRSLEAYLDGKQAAYAVEYRIRCADGGWKWMLERGMVVARSADGRPRRMVGTHTDVTERKRLLTALQESEARYRSIFENANTGIAAADAAGQVIEFNEAFRAMLGFEAEELRRMNVLELTHPDDVARELPLFKEILDGSRESYRLEKRYVAKDSRILWVDIAVAIVRDGDGKVKRFVAVVYDITARHAAEEKLYLMAQVFTSSGEGIVITDPDARIIAVNAAFTQLTGYSEEEVVGKNPRILSAGMTPPEVFADMWLSLRENGLWQGELWDRRKNGEAYPKWTSISAVRSPDGRLTHYIGSFNDISERKATEERILDLAHRDPLTKLPNRLNLQERLEQTLSFARRNSMRAAVMLIDLDRFKSINDTLGHHVGDQLLIEVAARLLGSVRESDIVARLGGDEFVVVVTQIDSPDDAARVAGKIVETVSMPYMIGGKELRTSPSIGICLYPDDAEGMGDLMKNADVAMYHAKAEGRSNFQFFREAMNIAAEKRMAIEQDLRIALKEGQFLLDYQPQFDLRSGRVSGVEALVRWRHPVRGLVPPMEFIPVAEEIGLILPLGDWILREACRQLREWNQAGIADVRMSVNLSAVQFNDASLPQRLQTILAAEGIGPEMLNLEITESMSMASPQDAITIMRTLTAGGLSLSIDDFGTGYSSLAYLKSFPIGTLKIDRSFVLDIETDPNDAEICDVTVLLAHKLGLDVVAEGVETEAQLKFLLSVGCEKIQGYLISRPLPAADVADFIRQAPARAMLGTVELWAGQ